MLNPEEYRRDIPAYGDKIFFNSAGSSLVPDSVNDKIREYLTAEAEFGGYALADMRKEQFLEFYKQAAILTGAEARNMAFMNNATDAYAKALSAVQFTPGDVIITTDDDYVSNQLNFISLQKRFGIRIVRIKNLDNGDLDLDHFQFLVKSHRPVLVAVTHVPTNSGLIQDVESIGAICREQDITYLVDACQSAGQLPLDVKKFGCDFLSSTGRKFLRGPRGTGFLYVSDRILEKGMYPVFVDGGGAVWESENKYRIIDSARRFETWEVSYALAAGFTEALRYANQTGLENIAAYNRMLMTHFRERMESTPGVRVLDRGSRTCNILSFQKDQQSMDNIQTILNKEKVYYGVSTREWGLIDFEKKNVSWAIRLSPHYFNTLEEVDRVTDIIDSI